MELLYNIFSDGELSPECDGLVGTEIYKGASKRLLNWLTRKEMCIERRGGLQFRFRSYNDANGINLDFRLYRFTVRGQSWIIEFSAAASGRSPVRAYLVTNGLQLLKPDGSLTRNWNDTAYTFQMPAANASRYNNPNYTILGSELFELDIRRDGDTIWISHDNHCTARIDYDDTATMPFSCSYVEFTGNGFLDDDLDTQNQNKVGNTPDRSRVSLSNGYFGDDSNSINPATFLGCAAVDAVSFMNLDDHPDGDEYEHVCREEWIDFQGIARTTGSISGTDGEDGWTAGIGNIHAIIRFTDRISDERMNGLVMLAGSQPFDGFVSYYPPVLGSFTELQLRSTRSAINLNDLGLSYMVDFGAFEIIQNQSGTRARAKCISQVKQSNVNPTPGYNWGADVAKMFNSALSCRTWARPAWGNNTSSTYTGAVETGWPKICCPHDGRLLLMRSKAEKLSIWGSASGVPENFVIGTDDDNAFQLRIRASGMDEIVTAASGTVLFMLTRTGIYRSVAREPLSPSTFGAIKSFSVGADPVAPVSVGPWIGYVADGGRQIYAIRYNDNIDQIEGYDITRYASHILGTSGVSQLDAREDEEMAIVAVLGDGRLAYGFFPGQEPKTAWSHIETFGHSGEREHIFTCAIGKRSGQSQIVCGVARQVNGSTRRFVEVIDTQNYTSEETGVKSTNTPVYTDSSLDLLGIFSGGGSVAGSTSGVSITGLSVLAGRVCKAHINGAQYDGIPVNTSGAATIPLGWNGSTVSVSGTTITFHSANATDALIGSYIVTSGGGLYLVSGYTSPDTMTCTVITGGDVSDVDWQLMDNLSIGIPYRYTWTPHIPEVQMRDGTAQCREKKIATAWVRVINTYGLKFVVEVPGAAPFETEIQMRDANEDAGSGPSLKTGDYYSPIDGPNTISGLFSITGDGVFPAKLLLCKIQMEVYPGA